ncbi:MAG: type IV pilus modification PilV family protein [Puniceicoccales bacterium]
MKVSSQSHREAGFSLVEVILAIGVFALTIVAVIGLLGPIAQQVRDLQDTKVANSLPAPIREELNRLGFDHFVTISGTGTATVQNVSETTPLELFATEDGSIVTIGQGNDTDAPAIPEASEYFLIEVFLAAPVDGGENLSYNTNPPDAHIAFRVNISWPYHVRTGSGDTDFETTAAEDRRNFEYFTAIVVGEPF